MRHAAHGVELERPRREKRERLERHAVDVKVPPLEPAVLEGGHDRLGNHRRPRMLKVRNPLGLGGGGGSITGGTSTAGGSGSPGGGGGSSGCPAIRPSSERRIGASRSAARHSTSQSSASFRAPRGSSYRRTQRPEICFFTTFSAVTWVNHSASIQSGTW